jgi:O-antigen/teichoic acid export membrane protein
MKRKLIHDISANSFQVIINQCCGLVIFYILSIHFTKDDFGGINWALALLLTAFSVLSFGIDQVAIKKIASGNDVQQILSVYIMHVLLAGFLFYGLLFAGNVFFKNFFHQHYLLLFLGLGKLMIFFSTPFKQLANGLEKFHALLYMSICSNIVRSIALIIFSIIYPLNLNIIIIIFIAGDFSELLLSILITKFIIKTPIVIQWHKKNYVDLIKESMPLGGVALFTSTMARFDWILLGLLASNIILANYSFAYKTFEVSTLPLLVIAPILIPRFTKLFHSKSAAKKENELFVLLRIEIVIASLTALVLNIVWIPIIDFITHGKYGAVNHYTILILSGCIPLLYINNFLWTILFAKGNFKQIFSIIAITFLINIIGDIFLILFFKAEGAALAYLLALFVQLILYKQKTEIRDSGKIWQAILLVPFIAIVSGILSSYLFSNVWLILFSALFIFISSLFIGKQFQKNDWLLIMRITGNH